MKKNFLYRTNNFVLFCFYIVRVQPELLFLFTEMASSNALQQQQLYIGQYFTTWDSAIAYVQKWCNTQGFQTRLNRSKRNADGQYQKLTIICQHAGNRKPLTEMQANNEKSSKEKISKSIQMGCKAHINLSRPEKNNVNQYVFVTTIYNEHCHELNCQLVNYPYKKTKFKICSENIFC
jgi:hypothetical protein